MITEAMRKSTRQKVNQLYLAGKSTDIILIAQDCLEKGSKQGLNFHQMIERLENLGVKQDEISIAVPLALANIPAENLNDIDKLAKVLADGVVKKFNSSLTASSLSNGGTCDKESSKPYDACNHKETWLFGEMQLDLSKSYDEIFEKAADIAENCGYMVTKGKDSIQIYGEDCPDSVTIVNTIYFANGQVSMVLKNILSNKDNKQIAARKVEIAS